MNPPPGDNRLFEGTEARMLCYSNVEVRTPSGRVVIAGLPWYAWRDGESALRGADTRDAYVVLMCHMPDAGDYAPEPVDLVLSGHTHGGQVRLPFIGPIVTFSGVGRDRAAGLSRLPNGGNLYVNRGLGMEGGGAVRIRLLCRPEIALFTIRPEH